MRLGGADLRELLLATMRAATAVVSQDTYLFYGTLAENLWLGRPEASDAEVEEAARQANIHEFITGLPDGYATMVSERGVSLSGGQRQRIARALQRAMDHAAAGRTTLLIAHRLSTIRAEVPDGRERLAAEWVVEWCAVGVQNGWGDEGDVAGVGEDFPSGAMHMSVVSRRRESHPPPLLEPCVTLSRHTAPIVGPLGRAPWRQWIKMPG